MEERKLFVRIKRDGKIVEVAQTFSDGITYIDKYGVAFVPIGEYNYFVKKEGKKK